jgi:nucleoside diphosphate kinase
MADSNASEGVAGTIRERTFIAIKVWGISYAVELFIFSPWQFPSSFVSPFCLLSQPDGVQRGLVGEVISRFERKGYKLIALKFVRPTKELAEGHYADLAGRPFFPGLVEYFSSGKHFPRCSLLFWKSFSGPIVAMVWEGHNVIKGGRKLVGATNPDDSAPGTIRGDFCIHVGR